MLEHPQVLRRHHRGKHAGTSRSQRGEANNKPQSPGLTLVGISGTAARLQARTLRPRPYAHRKARRIGKQTTRAKWTDGRHYQINMRSASCASRPMFSRRRALSIECRAECVAPVANATRGHRNPLTRPSVSDEAPLRPAPQSQTARRRAPTIRCSRAGPASVALLLGGTRLRAQRVAFRAAPLAARFRLELRLQPTPRRQRGLDLRQCLDELHELDGAPRLDPRLHQFDLFLHTNL